MGVFGVPTPAGMSLPPTAVGGAAMAVASCLEPKPEFASISLPLPLANFFMSISNPVSPIPTLTPTLDATLMQATMVRRQWLWLWCGVDSRMDLDVKNGRNGKARKRKYKRRSNQSRPNSAAGVKKSGRRKFNSGHPSPSCSSLHDC